ncbi:MAG: DUF3520 domain-containing protein, partial [Bacteroidia bacterium]|nr:DUF3520 domain-containing protein [Bacteroidia bacterium]
GSMQEENKLPLVKQSLKVLIENMRPSDHIPIVSYAAAAGLVLASTSCSEKEIINKAIDNMNAGGSTAGGEGLILAYNIAAVNAEPKSNNRIILVTDGDFNVGLQSDEEMQKLIEKKRNTGIFLTVCGFGMGNYKDSKMEILADKGNGNYYYIDNYKEAIKLFSTNLTGTLFTIAKDVKIQVEFNPAFVKAYRLIGYENRKLKDEDFEDDTKDAGELGSGHNVTALYEIVPAGSTMKVPGFTELKYQENTTPKTTVVASAELLTIKLRYKTPYKDTSTLIVKTMMPGNKKFANASESFRYAAGVTAFAMVLRNSKYKGCATYKMAKEIINSSDLNTSNGYKTELVQLIDKAALLSIPK